MAGEKKKVMQGLIGAVIMGFWACTVFAGDISVLGGYTGSNNLEEDTYAWQIQYMEGLSEHFAYSLSYINQGHFKNHHRDADAASFWYRTHLLDQHLYLGVGGGCLFYYDTVHPDGAPSRDSHGWGTIASMAATWYTDSPWFVQLQGNWISGNQSFDTLSTFAGIGYQLDAPPSRGGTSQNTRTTDNELTLFGGETIVNISGAGHSAAVALEYRRGLWRYLEWTARVLYEGESTLIDRYGLSSQLWLAKSFLDDRLALGVGFGGYLATDQHRDDNEQFVAEVASMTGSFRLNENWLVRATWDRIITNYDRDSDVILGGVGYRF